MSGEILRKIQTWIGLDSQSDEEYLEELDTKKSPKLVGLPTPPQAEMLVLEPRSFDDALAIITHLRERRAVIVNLHAVPSDQEQRLVDFVSGATHAIDGNQERVADHIFAFSPPNVKINAQRQNEQPWGIISGNHRDLAFKVR
ncbi:MAG: cell division protein SepF [Cyanobacteria bacterium NC_groundwater_1444_Ag_S-0.65um_54_12]|nr:cell division protein SepF [Cyanobacteria bacterium NC_groundwater_1444_Ag_S-0.65um_54_12]